MTVNSSPYKTVWLAGLSSLLLLGCSGASPTPSKPQNAAGGITAAELLEKMHAAYREVQSYADNASYVQHTVLRSEGVDRETPFFQMTLAFERPNKLRFKFQEAVASPSESNNYDVASNGTRVRSTASSVPQQVHEAEAPPALTLANWIPEPALRAAILGVSLENLHPPLRMLLADQAEGPIFQQDHDPKLLKEQKLGEASCYRVSMTGPAGQRVLWIDSEDYTLRRMELPIDAQRSMLNPNDMYSQIAIYVDFQEITRDAEIDASSFELEVPEGGRRVQKFISPPPPGPSDDLGKSVGDFQFTALDGEKIDKEALAGKIVLLDFWYTGCSPCKLQTPVLEKVYQEFKDHENIAFYAVSIDQPQISNKVVAKTMTAWGGSMPVLRDPEHSGFQQLKVRVTPTAILIDRNGHLQKFHAGVYHHPEPLIEAIQKMFDGEDLTALAVAKHEQQVEEYEQALEAATIKNKE